MDLFGAAERMMAMDRNWKPIDQQIKLINGRATQMTKTAQVVPRAL
jgi:hypothetical protein